MPQAGLGERPYYPELDGLRGVAAGMVMCFHFGPGLVPTGLLTFCQTGLDVFFVLSGFLITGILLRSPVRQWSYIRTFYLRRSLRIFPLYYFFLALWSLVFRRPLSGWYWVYLENVRYLGKLPAGPPHLWSLAVEEQFYLVWPFLVLFWPRRWLSHAMWTVLAISFALPILLSGSAVNIFYFTPTRMEGLAAGGLIAFYSFRGSLWQAWRFLLALGAVSFLLQPLEKLLSHGTGLAAVEMLKFSTSAGLYSFVVAFLVGGRKTLFHRLLSSPPMVALGRVSYGLYVYHRMVFEWLRGPLSFLPPAISELICFGAVYGVAWLSYVGFEKRFLRLRDRSIEATRPEAAASPEPERTEIYPSHPV